MLCIHEVVMYGCIVSLPFECNMPVNQTEFNFLFLGSRLSMHAQKFDMVLVCRSNAKPVAGLSVDGLHWYNTEPASDPSHPVWMPDEEDEEAAWRLPEASHQVLIPLKEMDLDLQARPLLCW